MDMERRRFYRLNSIGVSMTRAILFAFPATRSIGCTIARRVVPRCHSTGDEEALASWTRDIASFHARSRAALPLHPRARFSRSISRHRAD
jgi:hypothetical protein